MCQKMCEENVIRFLVLAERCRAEIQRLLLLPSHLPHVVKKRCDCGVLLGTKIKGEPRGGDVARRDKETSKRQKTLSKVQRRARRCRVFFCAAEKCNMHIRQNHVHFSQLQAMTYCSNMSSLEIVAQRIQNYVPLNIIKIIHTLSFVQILKYSQNEHFYVWLHASCGHVYG